MKKLSGIYCIENLENGKKYIGQSADIKHREKTHLTKLRGNYHASSHLQNAFNKYGENSFKFTILMFCEIKELTKWEQYFIDTSDKTKLYNVRLECVDSNLGMKHTEETKRKLSKIVTGRKLSKETRKKISEANSGENNYNYGKHLSEETKRKLSKANSGKNSPMYGKRGKDTPMYGKHHTKDSKQKTSDALMGHSVSEEAREKMSKAKTGEKNFYFNKKRKGASSKYLGVCYDKSRGKWVAHEYRKNKCIFIGRFSCEIEAAKAYDKYVIENNLVNRKLNFKL